MKLISRLNPDARRVSSGYANIFFVAEYPIPRPPLFKKSRPRLAPSDAAPAAASSAFAPFPASDFPDGAPADDASPLPAAAASPFAAESPGGFDGVAAPAGGPHPGSHANIRTAAA